MIKVEHLSFGFPNVELYHDISFTLEYGQHCAFIGSNGTGKTTLMNLKFLNNTSLLKSIKKPRGA